jgi:hypothetical protein
MAQNTSHAVMAQRAEPHDSLDDFPTQPWGTRALIMMLDRRGLETEYRSCLEPAANRGYMVRPLKERFVDVRPSDVHDYGCGYPVCDFLFPAPSQEVDWIITNPPFKLGQEFALTAIARAKVGAAMLVRNGFLEGGARYKKLYFPRRPHFAFQFVERLPMVKGRCDPNASTATSYTWLVWLKGERPRDTILDWIPPCRSKLERRESDYMALAGLAA